MKRLLILLITVWFALYIFSDYLETARPLDSTDNVLTGERSGLGIYVDHMTGCHYLSGGISGGITPRLDSEGDHICISGN